MIKERACCAIWPWGTNAREQMELAAKEVTQIGFHTFESVKDAIYAFDMDTKAYKEVLEKYNLYPESFYFHLPKLEESEAQFLSLDKELEFVANIGVKRICLQATQGRPSEMTAENMSLEVELIGRFAEKAKQFDIMPNIHPHHNTWVMYEDEIHNILQKLPDLIGFAPDTAHLVVGNCDPVKIIKQYINRVKFTHFKDIKSTQVESEGLASAGMEVYSNFCELGQGCVDFPAVFEILKQAGYDGPLCVELDKPPINNAQSAKNNFDYLMQNYEK